MPRQRKSTIAVIPRKRDDRSVQWAPVGSHPSQVSGLLKHDPTFTEFCEILRQQRQDDDQQIAKRRPGTVHKKGKAQRCLSSHRHYHPRPKRARTPEGENPSYVEPIPLYDLHYA